MRMAETKHYFRVLRLRDSTCQHARSTHCIVNHLLGKINSTKISLNTEDEPMGNFFLLRNISAIHYVLNSPLAKVDNYVDSTCKQLGQCGFCYLFCLQYAYCTCSKCPNFLMESFNPLNSLVPASLSLNSLERERERLVTRLNIERAVV